MPDPLFSVPKIDPATTDLGNIGQSLEGQGGFGGSSFARAPAPAKKGGFDIARALLFFGGRGGDVIAAETARGKSQAQARTARRDSILKATDAAVKEQMASLAALSSTLKDKTITGDIRLNDFPRLKENATAAAAFVGREAIRSYMALGMPENVARAKVLGLGTSLDQLDLQMKLLRTPKEAGQAEGTTAGTRINTQAQITGVPPEGSRGALETRTADLQNFTNRVTGETRSIRASDVNAVNQAVAQGFERIPTRVDVAKPGDLAAPQKQEVRDFRKLVTNVRVMHAESARLREQLREEGTFTGIMSGTVRGLSNAVEAAKQIAEAFGFDESGLLNTGLYKFEGFGPAAAKSSAFKANAMGLAYAMARSAEEGGGRLSEGDIQRQINILATNQSDKGAILAVLDEVDRGGKVRVQAMAKTLGMDVPEEFREKQKAPAVARPEGMSDDDIRGQAFRAIQAGKDKQVILDRLRAWGIPTTGLE